MARIKTTLQAGLALIHGRLAPPAEHSISHHVRQSIFLYLTSTSLPCHTRIYLNLVSSLLRSSPHPCLWNVHSNSRGLPRGAMDKDANHQRSSQPQGPQPESRQQIPGNSFGMRKHNPKNAKALYSARSNTIMRLEIRLAS
ncbi:hypothetical protein P175DRAFT_0554884 [Aspergillus ochraceoroseus IBT 24754]|uniref:Uncharacterized protein n=1 Tax=Aspergillus ochraceoroseus IBT 24754 TaxID=1392256 RepID=A0A2T5MAT7_9EURO|nr:uncharacterized protein P175DRAFT_0554884 [Aspergillus ochraceoroseus IBT 24754]PTU25653.1 hypothetical protein P175DRAFT_0554884 [Aspergillus ochraceoroseus IBT 24754]